MRYDSFAIICRLSCRTFSFVMPDFVLCLPARRCGISSSSPLEKLLLAGIKGGPGSEAGKTIECWKVIKGGSGSLLRSAREDI